MPTAKRHYSSFHYESFYSLKNAQRFLFPSTSQRLIDPNWWEENPGNNFNQTKLVSLSLFSLTMVINSRPDVGTRVVINRGNPTRASRLNLACMTAEATIRPQWVYWLSGSIFCRPSRLLRPNSICHMGSETRYVWNATSK